MINFPICCVLIVFVNCSCCSAQLTGHIVGGVLASIRDFPHAAHLSVRCQDENKSRRYKSDNDSDTNLRSVIKTYGCGSSIISQNFLISAAHCFDACHFNFVMVRVGSANMKKGGTVCRAKRFVRHEDFQRTKFENDIALVVLFRPLIFSKYIKKVAIMEKPPYEELAELVGWGRINYTTNEGTHFFKVTTQKIHTRDQCISDVLRAEMPFSSFCAGFLEPKGNEGSAARGDSGSGLIVRKYILVGVASYRKGKRIREKYITVFTDVKLVYKWIQSRVRRFSCYP